MKNLEYGPIVIEGWFDEDRIGYYDDDTHDDDAEACAVVFPGDMLLTLHIGHYLIPFSYIREVTTDDLWRRKEILSDSIGARLLKIKNEDRPPWEERYEKLAELSYINGILMDRLYMARFNVEKGKGVRLFISHSSKDKQFARWLSVDLANAGHHPWLDEWKIKAGQSIPSKISEGITDCQYVLVVLSQNSVKSNWVEREWQAKYWHEVNNNNVMVIPVLMEDCDIPLLLQTKKYADFTNDYQLGLEDLLAALYVEQK